jgi:hypothetical protein
VRCEVRGRAQLFDGAEDARGAGMAGVERRGPETAMRWSADGMQARHAEARCEESNCLRAFVCAVVDCGEAWSVERAAVVAVPTSST